MLRPSDAHNGSAGRSCSPSFPALTCPRAASEVGSGGQIHQPAYLTGGLHHIVGEYFYEPLQDPNPPILVRRAPPASQRVYACVSQLC